MMEPQGRPGESISLQSCIQRHSADVCVAYKTVEGRPLYLGLFLPEGRANQQAFPTVLLIHGGGWSSRKIFEDQQSWAGDYLGFLARYFALCGYLAVSIDYRLIQDEGKKQGFGVSDCIQDCRDAVRFVLGHAEEYSVDANQLYLLGESAGGYLAAALISFSDLAEDRLFQTVFLVKPITDLRDEQWAKYVPEGEREVLSPYCQIRGEDWNEHRSIVLLHRDADLTVSLAHSVSFHEKLQSLGIRSELYLMKGAGHAFLLAEYYPELSACRKAIDIILDRMRP